MLNEVTDDEETLCAGLLHYVIEDTETSYEELVHEFNMEIADLVMEMTYEGGRGYGVVLPEAPLEEGDSGEVRGSVEQPGPDGGLAGGLAAGLLG